MLVAKTKTVRGDEDDSGVVEFIEVAGGGCGG